MELLRQLQQDHQSFLATLARIQGLLLDADNRYFSNGRERATTLAALSLLDQLLRDLRRHERTEHREFFPLLRRRLPGLNPAIRAVELDHGSIQARIADFRETLDGSRRVLNREIIRKALALMRGLREHMKKEERGLFKAARTLPLRA